LTINVSHFFRDPTVFSALNRLVMPELSKLPRVQIWSAACANGEEPYSLAMLCEDFKPSFPLYKILATDIDPTVLDRARKGTYKEASIVEVPSRLRQQYLVHEDEAWSVKPELKRRISFERNDLTGKLPSEVFDLIICRNVMIYFNRQLQERLLREFHQRLNPWGFLVLGKTEVMLSETRSLYQVLDVSERIYQRKAPETPPSRFPA
jgi:chemotaxis protein methyltransferase CheR